MSRKREKERAVKLSLTVSETVRLYAGPRQQHDIVLQDYSMTKRFGTPLASLLHVQTRAQASGHHSGGKMPHVKTHGDRAYLLTAWAKHVRPAGLGA